MSTFTPGQLQVLKRHLEEAEYSVLVAGKSVTLDLVIKAQRVLENLRATSSSSEFASRTELTLLTDAVNGIMLNNFLLFKILEAKKLVSEEEMGRMAAKLAEEDNNERSTKATRSVGSKTGRSKRPAAKATGRKQ